MTKQTLDLEWLSQPPSRSVLAAGVVVSLVMVFVAFGAWGFAAGGFADDSYLWWTLAAFLAPLAASVAIAVLGHARPETGPAVGVAIVLLAVAFLAALLG